MNKYTPILLPAPRLGRYLLTAFLISIILAIVVSLTIMMSSHTEPPWISFLTIGILSAVPTAYVAYRQAKHRYVGILRELHRKPE